MSQKKKKKKHRQSLESRKDTCWIETALPSCDEEV